MIGASVSCVMVGVRDRGAQLQGQKIGRSRQAGPREKVGDVGELAVSFLHPNRVLPLSHACGRCAEEGTPRYDVATKKNNMLEQFTP